MLRNPIIIFILVVLLLLSAACYTSKLSIDVLVPATTVLPSAIQRVSILPLPGAPSHSGEIDSLDLFQMTSSSEARNVKMGFIDGIFDIFSTSPRIKRAILTDTVTSAFSSSGRLYWDDLRKVCKHDSTDVVLVLTRAICRDKNFTYFQNTELQPFLSDYTLISGTKWIFYEPYKEQLSASYSFTDTLYIPGNISTLEFDKVLYDAFFTIGHNAGYKLVPHWKNVNRIYYTGPGKDLRDAAGFVTKDHWHNATLIWNDIADNAGKKKASRAAFNIALAYERTDILDEAYLWISFADSIAGDKYSAKYKRLLQARIKTKTILDQQMTGN